MARFARLFLILPGLALVLAACGSVHAGTASPDAATSATATATTASPVRTAVPAGAVWKTIPVGLNTLTIHLAASGRVLLVPVQAPFGDRACLRDFRARLTAFRPAAAYVTIDYQAALIPGPDGLAGYGCPPGPVRTVRITLPAPPAHSDYDAVGCDGRWLVLNVGWPGGPAGCDGPSCGSGSTVSHWFFRASRRGWIVIASSRTAGCAGVHQAAPQFPTALCAALPAFGP